jgi:hypothetical protein
MEVFTTISPKGDTLRQFYSLKSWTKQGNVNSVNTAEEILLLKDKYPFVNFIECNETVDIDNKKLISIRSMFKAIDNLTKDTFIIINSDLSLSEKFDLNKFNVSNKEIFIGNRTEFRYDFTLDEYVIGKKYLGGYDIFVMTNEVLNLLISAEQPYDFAFGVPWWDYWVPFYLIESGIELISSKEDIILHETHKTNYSHVAYRDIGRKFLSYYNKLYPSKFTSNRINDRYHIDNIFTFSQGLNDNIISKKIIYK